MMAKNGRRARKPARVSENNVVFNISELDMHPSCMRAAALCSNPYRAVEESVEAYYLIPRPNIQESAP
jgi:hypothetical protein